MINATDHDLGNILSVHRLSYVRLLSKLLTALLLLVILLVSSDWFLLVAFVFLSPYLLFLPLMRLTKPSKIELYENGLRVAGKIIYWNQISGLSQTYLLEIMQLAVFHIGEYRLYRDNERVLSINYDYMRTDKLISVIEDKTAVFLIPRYLSELRDKGIVHFGKITLNQQRISVGQRGISLSEIGRADLWNNTLRLSKHRGLLSGITVAFAAYITYTKNYHILLRLIHLLVQQAQVSEVQTRSHQ